MPEKFTPSVESEIKIKKSKNQGQKINIPAIKGEGSWVGTVYDDGGFEYKIQPTNLEAINQEEIDKRVEAGEDKYEVLAKLADKYIQSKADELGIDPEGYVSATGRIYESATDPRIEEFEPKE
ncbi:MAG: hypothetical protein JXA91_06100 [Candidatus Thermoplasmatota archaeon]|nr:hypothetical protein [Candidatus Thermoplasmatota archaeon]